MAKNDEEVAGFWRQKEEELGEPVLMKSIAHAYLAGAADSFGILYAAATTLVYEYSEGGRRSFLDVLLTRKAEERRTRSIRIPRAELLAVGLAANAVARSWLRRAVPLPQAAEALTRRRHPSLLGLLTGTSVCVCTAHDLLVFDTPMNRRWLELLRA